MVFINGYEIYQWYQTQWPIIANNYSGILASTLLESEWNADVYQVFVFFIMLDKLSMAALLVFVWLGFPNYRQQIFLLMYSFLQLAVYHFQMEQYKDEHFRDLDTLKNAVLACSALSLLSWFLPAGSFVRTNNNRKTQKSKLKTS